MKIQMSIFSALFKRNRKKTAKIVTLGTSGAGKTTLIRFLETGKPVEEVDMTLGIDIRNKGATIGSWNLSTIDVGGQDLYKNALWGLAVTQADGIIYVIDGTVREDRDKDDFQKSKLSFEYMLNILNQNKPVLVLVNKQDLVELNPYSVQDAVRVYEITNRNRGRDFNVIAGSAKLGNNIYEGMEWLMEKIEKLK
ncbi:MAG: GTP-binding protein [Methanobacteriota archaeon]|nr:MAG: GTP-binding protein [Euryarchaeota archaeon]